MLCSVCHQKLAESDSGRKAHMARYHDVIAKAQKSPTYEPMDAKEKAAKIRRMEARLADKVFLGDDGQFLGYGVVTPTPIVVNHSVSLNKPVKSQREFDERLEALYQQSEALHKEVMEKFGYKQ